MLLGALAEILVGVLENWSLLTSITVLSSDSSRSVTKPTAICDQRCSGVGRGMGFPAEKVQGALALAQVDQDVLL